MIEILNLSKHFFIHDKRIDVLKELNLSIKKDKITVILGRSGCGKTTLLRLIAGLEGVSLGEIKFKEQAEKLDIKVPLVAGIMPVTNAKQIKRIIELSKCSVPHKLDKLLEKYGDNPESMKKAGIMYASEQIIELLAYGIKGIHIYTMNKPEIAKEIMKNIEFAR